MAQRALTIIILVLVSGGLATGAVAQAMAAPAASDQAASLLSDRAGAPSDVVADASALPEPALISVADPWLAPPDPVTGQRPPQPVDQVIARWQAAPQTPRAQVAAVRQVRLELGLGDLVAPAHAILQAESGDEPETLSNLARQIAPGVPAVQMAHARAAWDAGQTGETVNALGAAAWAAIQTLEIRVWLVENLSSLLLIVVLGSSLFFMVLSAMMVFSHAAHDLGDLISTRTPSFARFAGLVALLLVPVVLGEGVVGGALALFTVAFAYGNREQRKALAMAAVLLVIGLHPLARLATVTSTFYDREPIAQSVLAVAGGMETRADRERLRAASQDSALAAHALAYQARRSGLEAEALGRLDQVAALVPSDPVMLVNRGNAYMRSGETESAIEYYERANGELNSPSLLFNLSQAYSSIFQMESYEETIAEAQRMDDAFVADLSNLGEAKLVADLGIPFGNLQNRLISMALNLESEATVAYALAPGHLGESVVIAGCAFALVMLLCLLFANRFDHSSQCGRCGLRICTRCEETVWSDDICEDCHHLFQNPEATDPALRMARLGALARREVWLERAWATGSVLIPGVAGFASRRPDLAMFSLLLFGWAAAWVMWPNGLFADPMLMGSAAWVCLAVPGIPALLGYLGVLGTGLYARRNG